MRAYFCCDARRRDAVKRFPNLNGIDFLEVVDSDAPSAAERQRILRVHFLKAPAPAGITPANVRIAGGDRIRGVRTDAVDYDGDVLVVHVDTPGDFSTYSLRLVHADGSGQISDRPLEGLDPLLAAVDFSFKVECPTDFDCQAASACPTEPPVQPEINYLAKDYASFRQLMLDRLATLMPGGRESNAADLGVALVELLAYVGDYLSYRQDAVATEAYLGTARRRVSVRRHARLVDYFMHEGCSARVWIQVDVDADDVRLAKGAQLFTRIGGQPALIPPGSPAYAQALAEGPTVFETLHEGRFFKAHNRLTFYTWGDKRCCLPKGATSATLKGHFPDLGAGQVLLFEEVTGPLTGKDEDADPTRRHAVRLTNVTAGSDPLGGQFNDPPSTEPADVTEIEWAAGDALPFSFCISARISMAMGEQDIADVSIARGNVVLADHGLTIVDEGLGQAPPSTLFRAPQPIKDPCQHRTPTPIPPRFRPQLKQAPLTFAQPYDANLSANASLVSSPAKALPQVSLQSKSGGRVTNWTAQRDLLSSGPDAADFVVETDSDQAAYLRFGDSRHGLRPNPDAPFTATYRVGNGAQGNIGAEAIGHLVSAEPAIRRVRNPLPAQGGIEPESLEQVRRSAPFAFRTQERAVTPDDYAAIAGRDPRIRRAAATFRWTGSWHTVFLTTDRRGGLPVDYAFEKEVLLQMEPFRMAGHDLVIAGPQFVPLEIAMQVCVQPGYFQRDVRAALLQVFNNRSLPDGRRGVFHPDNFSFGQPVYLSPLYAAAQGVEGVASALVTTFQRQGNPSLEALETGRLDIERLEIARLDNDPDFPERGVFHLSLEGGK